MSELDGICHHEHVPIEIDSKTRERLHRYLMEKAPKGQGYTAFIDEALDRAEASVLWVVVWEWDGSEILYDGPFTNETAAEDWADFIESHLSPVEVKVVPFDASKSMAEATDDMKADIAAMRA